MFPQAAKEDGIINSLKNSAHKTSDELHETANQAGRKARAMFHTASDEISQAGERVSAEIHNNPVRSSLIALGVGMVMGALYRR